MRRFANIIGPMILIHVLAGCSEIQLPNLMSPSSTKEVKPSEPPIFDPRDMKKTVRWVDWTVRQFSPKTDNPLVVDEAIERIKAEFATVRGHEVWWDAAVSELGKTERGKYYLFIRHVPRDRSTVYFLSSLDRVDEKGLTLRVGEGVTAEFYKRLSVGRIVKLKGKCEIKFEGLGSILIVVYDCMLVEEESTKGS